MIFYDYCRASCELTQIVVPPCVCHRTGSKEVLDVSKKPTFMGEEDGFKNIIDDGWIQSLSEYSRALREKPEPIWNASVFMLK